MKTYTRHIAETLVHAYCHRMSWFAHQWEASDLDPEFELSDVILDKYVEPDFLAAEEQGWFPGAKARSRLHDLRRVAPRGRGIATL